MWLQVQQEVIQFSIEPFTMDELIAIMHRAKFSERSVAYWRARLENLEVYTGLMMAGKVYIKVEEEL